MLYPPGMLALNSTVAAARSRERGPTLSEQRAVLQREELKAAAEAEAAREKRERLSQRTTGPAPALYYTHRDLLKHLNRVTTSLRLRLYALSPQHTQVSTNYQTHPASSNIRSLDRRDTRLLSTVHYILIILLLLLVLTSWPV